MCRIGCGFVWLLIIVLSACSSNQSSLDSQIKEDLNKVLNKVSQQKNLSNKLSKTPPLSDITVVSVESTGESGIVDLVTFCVPLIKHNISLVKSFKEKLQFANSVQLKINNIYQNLKVTKSPAVLENANLVVWSG